MRGGDEPCGGSLSANLRVDGQKQHIRLNFGASMRNIAMSTRIKEDGKCRDCVRKVHALSRGDLIVMRSVYSSLAHHSPSSRLSQVARCRVIGNEGRSEFSRGHSSSLRVKARTQENALSHKLCTSMKPTGGDD